MKLRTRLLVVSSVFLIAMPILAYNFINKIQQSLLQGQEEAQLMTASAIATVVRGYTDLFDLAENALYVYPVQSDINIDGYPQLDEDWHRLKKNHKMLTDGKFSLLLLNDKKYLYVYLQVKDNNIVYRNPRYIPLDASDHVRLEYIDASGQHQRLIVLTEGQGKVSAYKVKDDWRSWQSGRHVNAVLGVWRETTNGYDVELRLPVSWVQSKRLSLSVVDVFGENERYPDTIQSTKHLDVDVLNPLLFRSKEISHAMQYMNDSTSKICIIDQYRRVRAVIGGNQLNDQLCRSTNKVSASLVEEVLTGKAESRRFLKDGETLLVAAYPVIKNNVTVGAVLVSNSDNEILSRQRDTLLNILFTSLVFAFLVFFSLLVFSTWLTFRINRLNKQASSFIDESGRFVSSIHLSDAKYKDEIGDLSRGFSVLLDKLNNYTCFLESVPSMLRHEILNPVNTISMSLQKLTGENVAPVEMKASVDVANNAILQLQLIVSSLTEAANIDEALIQDDVEKFDVAVLLTEYVRNSQLKHSNATLQYHGVNQGVFILGNDIRIVQLLDKLKDNALDFALVDSPIVFQLDMIQGEKMLIRVQNEGEYIPQDQIDVLFQGMVSKRAMNTAAPHLGIGLYVSYKIAKYHQGQLEIANRRDKQGVEVVLTLPIANL